MYYLLTYKEEVGCPAFLNGRIHEHYSEDALEKPISYDWYYSPPGKPLLPLPNKIVLITKEKFLQFDLSTHFGGHIISENFKQLMVALSITGYEIADLEVVSPKNTPVKSKKYYFMRFPRSEWLQDEIDLEKSKIDFRKDGAIKKIWSLELIERNRPHLFLLNQSSIPLQLICSEEFLAAAQKADLQGLEFKPTTEIGRAQKA